MKNKKRYLLIDGIRGIAILNMIAFHFLYDLNEVFDRKPQWYRRPPVHIWQQAICWTFILVSGFVWKMSRRTAVKRGIFLNVCGFAITLVTVIVIPEEAVWFGILNFMGFAVMLMIPVHEVAQKIPGTVGCGVSFFIFLCSRNIPDGVWGIEGMFILRIQEIMYSNRLFTILGFPYPAFRSSDYFPIFPWMALYLTGYFLFQLAEKSEHVQKTMYKKIPAASNIGQKSIWIYMIHQPLCMMICMIFIKIVNLG